MHLITKAKLINKEQEFLCRGGAKCTKQVHDKILIGVQCRSGISMDLLENGNHVGCQLAYGILVLGPEGNVIQLLSR